MSLCSPQSVLKLIRDDSAGLELGGDPSPSVSAELGLPPGLAFTFQSAPTLTMHTHQLPSISLHGTVTLLF